MLDAETRDIGRAIANCSFRLGLDVPLVEQQLGEPVLRSAHLCNRRLCPFCEWRRTRAWRARLIHGLETFLTEHPKHSAVFLTLTVRNCQVSELRETVRHMHESLGRLAKVSAWPTEFWMRRTEITVSLSGSADPSLRAIAPTEELPRLRGGRIQSVHPHLHCLLLVRPSYWGKDYVKQLRWQQEWQMAARLDYPPVVDVRRAKAKTGTGTGESVAPKDAVIEAAKYASKATDLLALGDALPAFHHEVRGLRLYGVSRPLQQFVKAADPNVEEMLDVQPAMPTADSPYLSATAQWFDDLQEYRFVA
jgi:plasmid rolling circle replication initiator protein Rep